MGVLSGGLRRVLGVESTSDSSADEDTSGEPEGTAGAREVPAGQHAPLERNAGAAGKISGDRFPYPSHGRRQSRQRCLRGSGTGLIAAPPNELLPVMERRNILALVNLTGGFGAGLLQETVARFDKSFPKRFYSFTEPSYDLFQDAKYPQLQADAIVQAHQAGASGLKILKTLGLYLA